MKKRDEWLEGWKEIESALGLSRHTILARGYPVRRGGGPGRRVYATRHELYRHEEMLHMTRPEIMPGQGRRRRAARLRIRRAATLRIRRAAKARRQTD